MGTYRFRTWLDLIQPYVRNAGVGLCPSGQDGWIFQGGLNTSDVCGPAVGGLDGSYSINFPYFDVIWWPDLYVTLGGIHRPASFAWYFESYCPAGDPGGVINAYRSYANRHNGGMNIAFFDGHAKWRHETQTVAESAIWRNDP